MTPLKGTYTGGIEVTWWVMASTAWPTDLPRAVRPVLIAWSSSDPSLATWHADGSVHQPTQGILRCVWHIMAQDQLARVAIILASIPQQSGLSGIPDAAAEAASQHPEGRVLHPSEELSLQVPWQPQGLHSP